MIIYRCRFEGCGHVSNRAHKMKTHENTHIVGTSLCHFCPKTFASHSSVRNHERLFHEGLVRSEMTHSDANSRLMSLKMKIAVLQGLLRVQPEPTACTATSSMRPNNADSHLSSAINEDTNDADGIPRGGIESSDSSNVAANVIVTGCPNDSNVQTVATDRAQPDLNREVIPPVNTVNPATSVSQRFHERLHDFSLRRLIFDVGPSGECTAIYEPLMSRDFEAYIDKIEKYDAHLGGLMKVSVF